MANLTITQVASKYGLTPLSSPGGPRLDRDDRLPAPLGGAGRRFANLR